MDGFDLGLGMLFPLFPKKARPRRHHEHRRAGVGRQRDLAGARRRRLDGGVSAGLCGADAGAVHADHRDAGRPDLSRRRLRISLEDPERTQPLGRRVCRRIAAGGAGAGHRTWRDPAGRACRGAAVCRRLVGLADAVHASDGCCHRRRLCPARRDLAGAEDRGRTARPGLPYELVPVVRDARRHRRGQHCHAVSQHRLLRSAGSPGPTSC